MDFFQELLSSDTRLLLGNIIGNLFFFWVLHILPVHAFFIVLVSFFGVIAENLRIEPEVTEWSLRLLHFVLSCIVFFVILGGPFIRT